MSSWSVDRIREQMEEGVRRHVFPGAVLLVGHKSEILFHEAFGRMDNVSGRPMRASTIFDLASLTKPLATAMAVLAMVRSGTLRLDQTLGTLLPEALQTDKEGISLDSLLRHTSGLPAHRPYYTEIIRWPEAERRRALRDCILREPLEYRCGDRELYSDLGYILLAWVLEEVSGRRFDRLVLEDVFAPLGIDGLFFVETNRRSPLPEELLSRVAPTEYCPWRKKLLCAEVHDDNAWAAGGIEGHAGLFGTAFSVWQICSELLASLGGKGAGVPANLLQYFVKRNPFGTRTAGFDTPSETGSSAGRYFSGESIGHLGFTGTSFWIDPVQSLVVILLSNRVHPDRNNSIIKVFRPEIHDAVMRCFCGSE